ncbi:hypothetical protein HBH98_108880 [Parastagonospora nodorum]|nr:hypothetical protein HBH53_138230 [Parastagonospora nodorum]KAH3984000.1 hypothetical protein HBH52_061720 [Parastagonospora nodorum]KAH4065761.1 hypothetical protein HBH50_160870 [Parastagonospora nodorum]KAH4092250.1 hypothetical protein HBH48_083930 [Parastagonospora nodorum]KAH4128937.1 hypothetical protein HBH47_033050 [Parastagonospora nodorum]
MCMLNFSPFDIDDEDGPDYPFPRARPRLAWALPVNMNKLGASLQALTDSAPQTTTLRLCHKFRDGPLSKLPQELLEHIVDNIQGAARAKCLPGWYQDSICWQGTCRHEDHYKVYGEEVEKLWQKIFVDKAYGKTFEKTNLDNKTEAEKVDMVQDWVQSDPSIFDNEEGYCLHFDAMFRWLDRCCTCPQTQPGDTRKVGSFGPMSKILKAQFGLEAVVYHEILSEQMYDFLPNHQTSEEHAYYTVCYLTLPQESASSTFASSASADSQDQHVESNIVHTAFRQIIDPSTLIISEQQRFRFTRALKKLNLKPHYHLSEMEPLIVHPIQDENLACLCSCRDGDCPGACPDIHSWDRPYCLEQTLKSKSKELAKESWPKLMQLAASDTITPSGWGE